MITLVLAAQDLARFEIELVDAGKVMTQRVAAVSPEGYVAALAHALQVWNVVLESIAAVAVVTGPGAFTASRVSTLLANAIGFTRNIPVYSLFNPSRLTLSELIVRTDLSQLSSAPYVLPIYDRPPNITLPNPSCA